MSEDDIRNSEAWGYMCDWIAGANGGTISDEARIWGADEAKEARREYSLEPHEWLSFYLPHSLAYSFEAGRQYEQGLRKAEMRMLREASLRKPRVRELTKNCAPCTPPRGPNALAALRGGADLSGPLYTLEEVEDRRSGKSTDGEERER